jgi:hypothetical protein
MQDHRVTVNVRAAQAVEHAKHELAGQFMRHVEELRWVLWGYVAFLSAVMLTECV